MSSISKTWCPDCEREVLNVVSCIADGWEFTCGKCHQLFVVRIERGLTPRAADGATGFCECGYMAKYPICTKCGRAYPPRR